MVKFVIFFLHHIRVLFFTEFAPRDLLALYTGAEKKNSGKKHFQLVFTKVDTRVTSQLFSG